MLMQRKRLIACCGIGLLLMLLAVPFYFMSAQPATATQDKVYVVRTDATVEQGMEAYIARTFREAEDAGAQRIILILNTFGGRVDVAEAIGERVRISPVPVTVLVEGKALSAGTYIALNAESIAMQPGSSIGSAALIEAATGRLVTDPKVVAYWSSAMGAAAELNHRNPDIAQAMVDPQFALEIPALERSIGRGQLLALSADEARQVGYAEWISRDYAELLAQLELGRSQVILTEPSMWENIAEFLTQPFVQVILLILGIVGVAVELFIPGFGLPGVVGVIGFTLYFLSYFIYGSADLLDVALLVIGIILLICELFMPGFGVVGLLGMAAIFAGIVMAAPSAMEGFNALIIAFVIAIVIVGFLIWRFKANGVWNKFILRSELTTEEGFMSNADRNYLWGRLGRAVTDLRPAGTVEIDGQRIDVVSEAEFVSSGAQVVVVLIEGTRVVVRQVQEEGPAATT
jgi:membrane-bound serine protease (ClpP class)